MNTLPAHWTETIASLGVLVAEHGHDLGPVEYLPEDACETPGGEVMLLGGCFFVWVAASEPDASVGLMVDAGVDCSDPSVGIFGAYEPSGNARPTTLAAVAGEVAVALECAEWKRNAKDRL